MTTMTTTTITTTTTFDALREIIAKDYEIPVDTLTPDTPLTELKIDSLALIELIFTLEEKYGVVADNVPADLPTLGTVADYIDELIASRDADAGASVDSGTDNVIDPDTATDTSTTANTKIDTSAAAAGDSVPPAA